MRPSVVLPQPDSPTSPKVSPRRTASPTPLTACSVPIRRRRIAPAVTENSLNTSSNSRIGSESPEPFDH